VRKVRYKTNRGTVIEQEVYGYLSSFKEKIKRKLLTTDFPFVVFDQVWMEQLNTVTWLKVSPLGLGWRITVRSERLSPGKEVRVSVDDLSVVRRGPISMYDTCLRVEIPKSVSFMHALYLYFGSDTPTMLIINNVVVRMTCVGVFTDMVSFYKQGIPGKAFFVNTSITGKVHCLKPKEALKVSNSQVQAVSMTCDD